MMRHSLAALALVALAAPAFAQAPPAPKPAPEMAQLKFFEGNWTCEGTVPASPMGPGGKMNGSVAIHSDLGGFWQSGKVKATGGGMPGTMEGMFHTTYDPAAKQYVMLWVDNMGGWAQSTAKGWESDTITYTGEGVMAGQKIPSKDVFKKNADGSLRHTWEMQIAGQWTPGGDETCKKAAK
jgi:hypothetical protein